MTRPIQDALRSIPGFDRLQEAEAMTRQVQEALRRNGHGALVGQVFSAHRSDPSQGIRGSRLVVVAQHQAAIAKLKLVSAPLLAQLQSMGLGLQSIHVRAPVAITQSGVPLPPARPPVPAMARKRLLDSLSGNRE
jgi:hypothetical protein